MNLKEQYKQLRHKSQFQIDAAKALGKSPATVRAWFSNGLMTSDIPEDKGVIKILKEQLRKAPKK